MKSLGEELTEVLHRHEPMLLRADMDASARAAAQVSNLLGCILANVLTLRPDQYRSAFEAVCQQVHKSAEDVSRMVMPTTTLQ